MLIAGVVASSTPEVEVPSNGVLNMKLNYPLQDKVSNSSPFAVLATLDPNTQLPIGLNEILQTIASAKTDDKIKGVVLDLTTFSSGLCEA